MLQVVLRLVDSKTHDFRAMDLPIPLDIPVSLYPLRILFLDYFCSVCCGIELWLIT